MAKRKKIPDQIVTDVLYSSARKCCYCFGLDQDLSTKNGQIAHLDKDPSNNEFNNLAWMCQKHHDSYDTRRSQTKNYHMKEALKYRDELYALIQRNRDKAEENLVLSSIPKEETEIVPQEPKEVKLAPISEAILKYLDESLIRNLGGANYLQLKLRFDVGSGLELHLQNLLKNGYIGYNGDKFHLLNKAKLYLHGHTL